MKARTFPAAPEHLGAVLAFITEELEKADCSMKVCMQVQMAAEEIFVNIAHYAYHPVSGSAEVRCEVGGEPPRVVLQFMDGGKPFDPLKKPDADTALSTEAREIGGLGILMVKKTMDAVRYAYQDGKNILTIEKEL